MSAPQFTLFDFSGGLHESGFPTDYTNRQWQKLKGFVLEPNGVLRSQWECQRVTTVTGVASVRSFRSGGTDFLVIIKTDGSIHWAVAPSETATNTTTAAITTWNAVTTANPVEGGSAVSVPSSTTYRFMCEMPMQGTASKAPRNGLIINSASISVPAVVLYEDPTSAGTLLGTIYTGAAHRYPDFFLANESGVITGDPLLDIIVYGTPNVMPHGTVGCMWGDFLCVAGTRWFPTFGDAADYQTAELTDANSTPMPNGFWISRVNAAGVPDTNCFHPLEDMFTGNLSSEATITDMRVVDQGLVLFTTAAGAGRSGVVLIRGVARDSKPFPIKDGIGTADQSLTDPYQKVTGVWPEEGIIGFVEKSGGIWYTDGDVVKKLDKVGPGTLVSGSVWGDCAEGLRGYLIVSRGTRLLCLNSIGREEVLGGSGYSDSVAAWTELVTPNSAYANTSLTAIGRCLYFVNDGKVYRYTLAGADRGSVAGSTVNLTVVTAPVADVTEGKKPRWTEVGVEVHKPSDSTATTTPTIVSLGSSNGSLFTNSTPATNPTTVGRTVTGDTQAGGRGHGQSRIASATATLTGDLIVDGMRIWALGVTEDRTHGGK